MKFKSAMEIKKFDFCLISNNAEFVPQLSIPVYFPITVPCKVFTFQIEMYFSEFVVLGFELNLKVKCVAV